MNKEQGIVPIKGLQRGIGSRIDFFIFKASTDSDFKLSSKKWNQALSINIMEDPPGKKEMKKIGTLYRQN